ncbi:MAG TPA: L,D-transpeptidase [Panacibacter sp.]|nr:L,D-transpeptidase [Panacibacter sp.]HNP46640.1 L,D-transpeptidase [Panacibacter sp.]
MKNILHFASVVAVLFVCASFREKHYAHGTYFIVVEKSKFELTVFDDDGWLVKYPVVFGNDDLGDKLMEGDRKTPEGNFTVVNKRVHEKWDRFIMLDYPTKESYDKFNYRKAHGIIPKSAQIGGGIGIHGVWPHEEFAVDRYDNWTQGCISMKNEDVEELYSMVKPGTKVIIKK